MYLTYEMNFSPFTYPVISCILINVRLWGQLKFLISLLSRQIKWHFIPILLGENVYWSLIFIYLDVDKYTRVSTLAHGHFRLLISRAPVIKLTCWAVSSPSYISNIGTLQRMITMILWAVEEYRISKYWFASKGKEFKLLYYFLCDCPGE